MAVKIFLYLLRESSVICKVIFRKSAETFSFFYSDVGERANTANKAVFLKGGTHTDKKENQIFLIGNLEWSSCKVIYEEGLPNI